MKQLVEFPLENGESIFVEIEETTPTPTDDRIGIVDNVATRAKQTFSQAIAKIQPIANGVINKVRNLDQPADEVQVKFGLKMSANLGAVIASGNGEVNLEITLKWNKPIELEPTTESNPISNEQTS